MNLCPEIADRKEGFEGAILGLPLADVLQLKHQNHFSGCVTVTHADREGRLFFRNGSLIHAVLPDCDGEEACYRILSWTSGQFKVDPKVHTTRHTIDKPLNFLILEACRLMDEQQFVSEEASAKAAKRLPARDFSAMLDAFYARPEVFGAVVTKPKGQMRISKSYQEQKSGGMADSFLLNLASDGEYLFLIGRHIGHLLNLGDLKQTSFLSTAQTVVSMRTEEMALHVAYRPGQSLASARRIIRSTLTSLGKNRP